MDVEFFTRRDFKKLRKFLQKLQIKFLSDFSTYLHDKTKSAYKCSWFQDIAADWRYPQINESISAVLLATYESLVEAVKQVFRYSNL